MKKLLLVALVVSGFLGFYGTVADADEKSIEAINALLEKEKSELKQLKAQIEKQTRKISSAGKKEMSLLNTLNDMESQVKLKKRELGIYKWNIEINKKKVVKLTRNIKIAEKSMAEQKSTLSKWLRTLYKDGALYPIKVLFSADNVNDMIQRMKYMTVVTEYDASLFQKYSGRLEKLSRQKKALIQVRSDLMLWQKNAKDKKNETEAEQNARIKFLRRLKKDKALFVKVQKEYTQRSSALSELILRLEKKMELGENLDFADHKGQLSLPVKGEILSRFGKKRDKQYNVYIVRNGVNIRAKKGTQVRAVYSGKVLYVGSLAGYGNLTIVGHGENYHSVYGHMGQIITGVGESIEKGQVLGKSGDSGSIIGEALYFELRHGGKAIEPTAWFRLTKR